MITHTIDDYIYLSSIEPWNRKMCNENSVEMIKLAIRRCSAKKLTVDSNGKRWNLTQWRQSSNAKTYNDALSFLCKWNSDEEKIFSSLMMRCSTEAFIISRAISRTLFIIRLFGDCAIVCSSHPFFICLSAYYQLERRMRTLHSKVWIRSPSWSACRKLGQKEWNHSKVQMQKLNEKWSFLCWLIFINSSEP